MRAGIVSHDVVSGDQRRQAICLRYRVTFILVGHRRVAFEEDVSIFSQSDVILDVKGRVCPNRITLEVGIDECTLLVKLAERHVIRTLVTSAARGNGMLLPGGWLEDVLEPVITHLIGLDDLIRVKAVGRRILVGEIIRVSSALTINIRGWP